MTSTSMSPVWCRLIQHGVLLTLVLATTPSFAQDATPEPTTAPVLLPVPQGEETTEDVIRAAMETSDESGQVVLISATSPESDDDSDETELYPRVTQVGEGTSSRKVRKAAIEALPLRQLHPQHRQAANSVLDDMSLFRQLPAFQCELDPRVHDYFTNHPDAAVSIWRAMAISNLQMTQRNGVQYDLDTRDGTTGMVTVLHHTRESCLVICDGMFKSPYLKNAIQATSMMHLRTQFSTTHDGRTLVTHQADLFVSFPAQGVGTVAKLVSPVSNQIIDRNFQEICLFIHVMWQAMKQQPGWVEQIASRMEGIHPSRKEELVKLTADVYVTERTEEIRRSGQPVSLEVIRPPSAAPNQTASAQQPTHVQ